MAKLEIEVTVCNNCRLGNKISSARIYCLYLQRDIVYKYNNSMFVKAIDILNKHKDSFDEEGLEILEKLKRLNDIEPKCTI